MPEEYEAYQEYEQWNTAKEYAQTLRGLLNVCNQAQLQEDAILWYKTLYCLYKELDAKLNPEERKKAQELLKNVIEAKNNKKGDMIAPFVELELYLRQSMENKGLLTRKSDDGPTIDR